MNLANEMSAAGYTVKQASDIKAEVAHYAKVRDEIKIASGDDLDMRHYEPAMRALLDMYIRADDSELLIDFDDRGLLQLINAKGTAALDSLPEGIKKDPEAMAEAIENNIRKTIVDENPVNPKYYAQMSVLLDELIKLRRKKAIEYQDYLEQVLALAKQVVNPDGQHHQHYPESVDTRAKRALFDNFGQDEVLVAKLDTAIRYTKKAEWLGDRFKERELANAIREEVQGYDIDVAEIMTLVKAQQEYH